MSYISPKRLDMPPKGNSNGAVGDMDLLHKLDGPDQWWFAPLIWAGADGGMMLGDVGGLIGVILLILIIAVFVLFGFRG